VQGNKKWVGRLLVSKKKRREGEQKRGVKKVPKRHITKPTNEDGQKEELKCPRGKRKDARTYHVFTEKNQCALEKNRP